MITADEFLTGLFEDLRIVIGARAGAEATLVAATPPVEPHWIARLRLETDGQVATSHVGIPRSAAVALAALSASGHADVPDAAIAATVRDVMTTAVLAVNARVAPATLVLLDLVPEPHPRLQGQTTVGVEVANVAGPFVLSADVSFIGAAPQKVAAAAVPDPEPRLDVLLDIDLPVVVRFGHTDMPLRALTKLGPGSIVDLGRSPDDPVEVLVSNRVVAHGEVVVVGGNYGVRILDVVSPSERMRSMEG